MTVVECWNGMGRGSATSPSGQFIPAATDANHVLAWTMEGTSGHIDNSGSAGDYPFNEVNTPGRAQSYAMMPYKCSQIGTAGCFATPRSTPNPLAVPSSFTAEIYWRPDNVVSTPQRIFMKKAEPNNGWAAPYVVFSLQMNTYMLEAAVVTGANVINWLGNTGARVDPYIALGIWHHIALTFDGSGVGGVADLWLDGYQIDTVATASPTVDQGGGGEYIIGARALDLPTTEQAWGGVYLVRVSDTVRSDAYLQQAAQLVGVFI